MPASRAVVVLGMHRSGTSVVTRGLQTLGVYLGDDFLDATPGNPKGYWEDKGIVALNERVLSALGLNWQSATLIDPAQWLEPEIQALSDEAAAYLQTRFLQHRLWGFKDPRTLRLLPFWRGLLQRLGVDENYVVAIRHPLGVKISLLKREHVPPPASYLISLVYLVPYLHEIAGRPMVVTDYDLLMADPRTQMMRISRALTIPLQENNEAEIEHFSRHFLDAKLRHNYFSRDAFDAFPIVSPLMREAYFRLYELAADERQTGAPEFWAKWKTLRETVEGLVLFRSVPEMDESSRPNGNSQGLPR